MPSENDTPSQVTSGANAGSKTNSGADVGQASSALSQRRPLPAIILVQPTGPLNIGSIARSMKNFGFSDLRLVDPKTDHLSPDARRMAMRAADILEGASVHPTTRAALQGLRATVAFTARLRSGQSTLMTPAEVFAELRAPKESTPLNFLGSDVGLLFGPEESGLSNEDLSLANFAARFSTSPDYPSLNLAQAVTISCYEWIRTAPAKEHRPSALPYRSSSVRSPEPLLASEHVQELLDHAEDFFRRTNFINAKNRNARMHKFSEIVQRARLTASEGRFIRALFYFVSQRFS